MFKAYYREIERGTYRISVYEDSDYGYSFYRYFMYYTKRECLKMIRDEIRNRFHVKGVHLIPLNQVESEQ